MVTQVNRVDKTAMRRRRLFSDIGWSVIAAAALVAEWILASNYNQIPLVYSNLILMIAGLLLAVSLLGIMMGVWKASFRWKFLSVALALVWLVPFILYVMSFAGPLFDIHFTW